MVDLSQNQLLEQEPKPEASVAPVGDQPPVAQPAAPPKKPDETSPLPIKGEEKIATPKQEEVKKELSELGISPKGSSKKTKVILATLGVLLLIATLPAAVYLIKQRQEIRKEAAETPLQSNSIGGTCESKPTVCQEPPKSCSNISSASGGYEINCAGHNPALIVSEVSGQCDLDENNNGLVKMSVNLTNNTQEHMTVGITTHKCACEEPCGDNYDPDIGNNYCVCWMSATGGCQSEFEEKELAPKDQNGSTVAVNLEIFLPVGDCGSVQMDADVGIVKIGSSEVNCNPWENSWVLWLSGKPIEECQSKETFDCYGVSISEPYPPHGLTTTLEAEIVVQNDTIDKVEFYYTSAPEADFCDPSVWTLMGIDDDPTCPADGIGSCHATLAWVPSDNLPGGHYTVYAKIYDQNGNSCTGNPGGGCGTEIACGHKCDTEFDWAGPNCQGECNALKAYDDEGLTNDITAGLTDLNAGDVVYFGVTGTTTDCDPEDFTRARFKITVDGDANPDDWCTQGVGTIDGEWCETENSLANQFYVAYEIFGGNAYKIEAMLWHPEIGEWR